MKNFVKCIFCCLLLMNSAAHAALMDINFRDIIQADGKKPAECENRLSVLYNDGHAYVDFACRNCQNGAMFQKTYSLYPEGFEEEAQSSDMMGRWANNPKLEDLGNNAKLQLVLGLLIMAIKQAGIISFNDAGEVVSKKKTDFLMKRSTELSTHILSDDQARAALTKLEELLAKSLTHELLCNIISYNCMDFPQTLYEAAGLPGHYLENSKKEIKLFWEDGQVSPASVYVYLQYGDIWKLIKQIYSQMIMGEVVKEDRGEMCENVLAQECLQTDDLIELYEERVSKAYEVFLKTTCIGWDDEVVEVALLSMPAFHVRPNKQGFEKIGIATASGHFVVLINKGVINCELRPGVQTYSIMDCSSIRDVTVCIRTDERTQVHWIEIEISGKKSNQELEESLKGLELISPKGNRLLYAGSLTIENMPQAIADSAVDHIFRIGGNNGHGAYKWFIMESGEKACLGYPAYRIVYIEFNKQHMIGLYLGEVGVRLTHNVQIEFEGKQYPIEIMDCLVERDGHLEVDVAIVFK